jgi:hypothetical protein
VLSVLLACQVDGSCAAGQVLLQPLLLLLLW